MKVIALLSGGKDSLHNLTYCVALGHEPVAVANLHPREAEEIDSFCFQSVGHALIPQLAEALGLPLYRQPITGEAKAQGRTYRATDGDEVEDLAVLLERVMQAHPEAEAVSVGAILSDYQRVRVESICARLGLTVLAFLWRRDQSELLHEMLATGLEAIAIKIAAMGLTPKNHLGKTLGALEPTLQKLCDMYGVHPCGEGGEYESLVLDSPLFRLRLVLDECTPVLHSDDAFAPVAYLKARGHLEPSATPAAGQAEAHALLMEHSLPYAAHFAAAAVAAVAPPRAAPVSAAASVPDAASELLLSVSASASLNTAAQPASLALAFRPAPPSAASPASITLAASAAAPAQMRALLEHLKATLEAAGRSLADVVYVHLFVADMGVFGEVNKVYKSFFDVNPPARVCVEVPLPSSSRVMLDAVMLPRPAEAAALPVDHMHVQSLSFWAPANIGPYSQAVKLGSTLVMAGQIGMEPPTLQLHGGFAQQMDRSLASVANVLEAYSLGPQHIVQAICWLAPGQSAEQALLHWQRWCDGAMHAEAGAADDASGAASAPSSAALTTITVPCLPRNALVEISVVAHTSKPGERQCGKTEACGWRHEWALMPDGAVFVQSVCAAPNPEPAEASLRRLQAVLESPIRTTLRATESDDEDDGKGAAAGQDAADVAVDWACCAQKRFAPVQTHGSAGAACGPAAASPSVPGSIPVLSIDAPVSAPGSDGLTHAVVLSWLQGSLSA